MPAQAGDPAVPAGPIEIADCHDAAAWDAYVHAHPDATAYHRFAWRSVFEGVFRHPGVYLAARAGGRMAGVLPLVAFSSAVFGRFAVSLPFVNYGGVLADSPPMARALANAAVGLARDRGWRHVELRHLAQAFPEWPSRRHKVAMWKSLPADPDALWASTDRKVRNLVRKAEKAGCVAQVGGIELVDDFYRVFAHNMRDLGTPVYPRRFFERVASACAGDARVHVVRVDGAPVAGSVTIAFREAIEVPWASSLRAHSDKAPNMLLYWSMLSDAVARGAGRFDFGRSTAGEGTFHFKRQWGAQPQPLVWEYLGETGDLPDRGPANPRFRAAIAIWQRLPVRVATWCGPSIVRHFP